MSIKNLEDRSTGEWGKLPSLNGKVLHPLLETALKALVDLESGCVDSDTWNLQQVVFDSNSLSPGLGSKMPLTTRRNSNISSPAAHRG